MLRPTLQKSLVTLRPEITNNLHFCASFLAIGQNNFVKELDRFTNKRSYWNPAPDLVLAALANALQATVLILARTDSGYALQTSTKSYIHPHHINSIKYEAMALKKN